MVTGYSSQSSCQCFGSPFVSKLEHSKAISAVNCVRLRICSSCAPFHRGHYDRDIGKYRCPPQPTEPPCEIYKLAPRKQMCIGEACLPI